MTHYRVYALSSSGSIVRQAYFAAGDDAAAAAWAEQWDSKLECELWAGHRKVTVIHRPCAAVAIGPAGEKG